jgi:hypothetical protein
MSASATEPSVDPQIVNATTVVPEDEPLLPDAPELGEPEEEKAEVVPEPPADLEPILPTPTKLDVAGIECNVRRLKTRELLLFMRVISNGFGPGIVNIRLNLADREEAASQMLAMLLISVPNAVEEFLVFVQNVVEPVDPKRRRDLNRELENPEIEVLLEVAERVVLSEKDDLTSLLGKGQAMWSRMQGAFQQASSSGPGSDGRSPASSTS